MSLTVSRALLRWLHYSFGLLKLVLCIGIDLFCAYWLIVFLVVVGALLVPFWIFPYAPHEPPSWADQAEYVDTPLGTVFVSLGFVWYIFSAAIPTLLILLIHVVVLILRLLEFPLFYFLVYTIEAMQRTEKWLLAMLINIVTVVWTFAAHWEKLFGAG